MRLRNSFEIKYLADRYNISTSAASRIFKEGLDILYKCLQCLLFWPENK